MAHARLTYPDLLTDWNSVSHISCLARPLLMIKPALPAFERTMAVLAINLLVRSITAPSSVTLLANQRTVMAGSLLIALFAPRTPVAYTKQPVIEVKTVKCRE